MPRRSESSGGSIGSILSSLRDFKREILYADTDGGTILATVRSHDMAGNDTEINPVGTTRWAGNTSGSLNRQVNSRNSELTALAGRIIDVWCNSNNGLTGGQNRLQFQNVGGGAIDIRVFTDRTVPRPGGLFAGWPVITVEGLLYTPPTINGGLEFAFFGIGDNASESGGTFEANRGIGFIGRIGFTNWRTRASAILGSPAGAEIDTNFSRSVATLLKVRYVQPTPLRNGRIEYFINGRLVRVVDSIAAFSGGPIIFIRSDGTGSGSPTGQGRESGTVLNPASVHCAFVEVREEAA